jgi:formate hydrogenlyase transcriptional activator
VKLLRVLQEREFERIGGNQTIKSDVRVVAATNRDLQKAIRESEFRSDLFYRLNVFPVTLPPLRERQGDIPLLVHFFVQKYASRVGRRVESIDVDTMRRLTQYSWPGNIRELENIIERALILGNSPVLRMDADVLALEPGLPTSAGMTALSAVAPAADGSADLNTVQREHIVQMLRDTNWVIEGSRGAAHRLGLKPGTLRHRMKKLGIARSESRTE